MGLQTGYKVTLGTKIAMISNPLIDVMDHFDKLYQLADAPSTLVQVSPTCKSITHNF